MGYHIESLTYDQVKPMVNKDTIVVLPIGGGTIEHGNHLPLGTDLYVAQYLADQVTEQCDVLTLPTLSYTHCPAFGDWKGSVNIESRTFIDVVKDILISFARHGVRKFVIIDCSGSSKFPLYTVSTEMFNEWNARVAVSLGGLGHKAKKQVIGRERGSHASESETSLMLQVAPELVHMEKAVEEYQNKLPYGIINGREAFYYGQRMVSEHGVDGNPLSATREKGVTILEDMVKDIVTFIASFRQIEIKEIGAK